MKKKTIQRLLITISSIVILLIAFFIYSAILLNERITVDGTINIIIPKDASIEKTINIFNQNGLLKPSWFFKLFAKTYAKLYNNVIHTGCYRFDSKNRNIHLIKAILTGENQLIIKVTYPEGITLKDFASITQRKLGVDSAEFIGIALSDSLIKARKIPAKTIEGYLMPETYEFFWKETAINVIDRLLNQQNKIWNQKFAQKADSIGKTRHEILTLASIVEAESPVNDEKARIAGVYYNRLSRNWKLQADPTVQYALGLKKKLTLSDLEYVSPYNTYLNYGLPPTPINSPSIKSIEAVLNPEKHNYFFFVASGISDARHYFASTGSQHLKNKQLFKQTRKK